MTAQDPTVLRNRALQAEWYGEPLGDRLRRLLEWLGLSQSGLAESLGLSAPMLSQLMSGHRAKISNPAVLARLLEIEQLAADPGFLGLPPAERHTRLARIRAETPTTSASLRVPVSAESTAPPSRATTDPVVAIQTILRSAASAAEIEAAAALLDADHPDLAHVLRVYGNGRTGDARADFARFFGGT